VYQNGTTTRVKVTHYSIPALSRSTKCSTKWAIEYYKNVKFLMQEHSYRHSEIAELSDVGSLRKGHSATVSKCEEL
jgi:hypothetical protein